MIISQRSQISGIVHHMEIDVHPNRLELFYHNKLGHVQDAFPNLTAEEREFIITGITPTEWNEMFSEEEEES